MRLSVGGVVGGRADHRGDRDCSLSVDCHLGSRVVNQIVVLLADRNEVVEIGASAVFPMVDVVDVTIGHRNLTTGHETGCIHRFDRSALSDARGSALTAEIEHHTPAITKDRDQCCSTSDLASDVHRD